MCCLFPSVLFYSHRNLQWTDLYRSPQSIRTKEWKHSLSEGVFKSVERSVVSGVREWHLPPVPVQLHSDPLEFPLHSEGCRWGGQGFVFPIPQPYTPHSFCWVQIHKPFPADGLINHTHLPVLTPPLLHPSCVSLSWIPQSPAHNTTKTNLISLDYQEPAVSHHCSLTLVRSSDSERFRICCVWVQSHRSWRDREWDVSTDLHKGNRQTRWAPNDINWVSQKQHYSLRYTCERSTRTKG